MSFKGYSTKWLLGRTLEELEAIVVTLIIGDGSQIL